MRLVLLTALLALAGFAHAAVPSDACDNVGVSTGSAGCNGNIYHASLVSTVGSGFRHRWYINHPIASITGETTNNAYLTIDRSKQSGCADYNVTIRVVISNTTDPGDLAICVFDVAANDLWSPTMVFDGGVRPTDNIYDIADSEVLWTPVVTASDACEGVLEVVFTEHEGEEFEGDLINNTQAMYTISRRWSVHDSCGNFDSHEQLIQVTDEIAPVIANWSAPPFLALSCDEPIPDCQVSATDNSMHSTSSLDIPPPVVTFVGADESANTGCASRVYTRTWTATDAANNTNVHVQTIQFYDKQVPDIMTNAVDQTVECDSIPDVDDTWVTDNCDKAPTVAFDESQDDGNITRTWLASDACGNTNKFVQVITFADTTNPEIILSSDETVACGAHPPIPCFASVTDNCDDDPRMTMTEISEPGSCSTEYKLVHSYTATDASGNLVQQNRSTTVVDESVPTLNFTYAGVPLESYCSLPDNRTVTASDICEPNVAINGVTKVGTKVSGNDYNFQQEFCYSAKDACGNEASTCETINVHDLVPAVLSATGNFLTQNVLCDAIPDPLNVTANDACCGDVAADQIDYNESRTDLWCADSYILYRRWNTTDCAGNPSERTEIINVSPAPISFDNYPNDTTFEWTVDYRIDTMVTSLHADFVSVVGTNETCTAHTVSHKTEFVMQPCSDRSYKIIQTWTVNPDNCFQTNITHSQTITVQDTTAPSLSEIQDRNGTCRWSNDTWGATSVDTPSNETHDIDIVCDADVIDPDCPSKGSRTCTISATDGCGNMNETTVTETWDDTEKPVIDNSTKDVSDNCDGDMGAADYHETNITDYTCEFAGAYRKHWNKADACGNNADEVTESVYIPDTEAPEFSTTPSDTTLTCMKEQLPTLGTIQATDNRDESFPKSVSGSKTHIGNQTCGTVDVYTWSVTDCAGLSVNHTQTITRAENASGAFRYMVEGVDMIDSVVDKTIDCEKPYSFVPPDLEFYSDCYEAVTVTPELVNRTGDHWNEVYIYKWSKMDNFACSSAELFQTVTVVDTTPPTISISDNSNSCAHSDNDPTATDDCSYTINCTMVSENSTKVNGTDEHDYQVIRDWVCTDDEGLTDNGTQTLVAVDVSKPIFQETPGPITEQCNHTAQQVLLTNDVCAGDINATLNQTGTVTGNNGVLVNTWTVTDDSGNTETHVQTVTVQDIAAPVITPLIQDVTHVCFADVPNVPTQNVSASDNCNLVSFTMTNTSFPGACLNKGHNVFSWLATDDTGAGLKHEHDQTLFYDDSVKPVFNQTFNDTTVAWNQTWDQIETLFNTTVRDVIVADASDNCGVHDVTCTVAEDLSDSCEFTYTWSCSVCDECSNCLQLNDLFKITQTDDRVPDFDTKPADDFVICNSTTVDPVAPRANLTTSGVPGNLVTQSSEWLGGAPTDGFTCTKKIHTWSTTHCGRSDSHTQTISVLDVDTPEMNMATVPAYPSKNCTWQKADMGSPEAIDTCAGTFDAVVTDNTTNTAAPCDDCGVCQHTVRTIVATDTCGNSDTLVYEFDICDSVAPVISPALPVNETWEAGVYNNTQLNRTCADNCDSQADSQEATCVANEVKEDVECPYNYTLRRTWESVDTIGHKVLETQFITVRDTRVPVMHDLPDKNVQISYGEWAPSNSIYRTAANVTADDTASGDITPEYTTWQENNVGVNNFTVFRKWVTTDDCLHEVEFIQTIKVTENRTCEPEDYTYDCNESSPYDPQTFIDDCVAKLSNDVTITVVSQTTAGDCDNAWTQSNTYTIKDTMNSGDQVNLTQTFTFEDNHLPTWDSEEDSTRHTNFTKNVCTYPAMPVKTASQVCGVATVNETDAAGDAKITYTYVATDECGKTITTSHIDTSTDMIYPEWVAASLPANVTVADNCTEPDAPADPTCDAFCSRNCTVTRQDDETISASCPTVIVRKWQGTDGVHTINHHQTVSYNDTSAPVVVPNADLDCECDDVCLVGATVTDNCATTGTALADPVVTIVDSETTNHTWTKCDVCGNCHSATQQRYFKNHSSYVITPPADVTVDCSEMPSFPISITDDCDEQVDVNDTQSDNITAGEDCDTDGILYTVVRKFYATDLHGLYSEAFQTIVVKDNEDPVIGKQAVLGYYDEQCVAPNPNLIHTDNCLNGRDDAVNRTYTELALANLGITQGQKDSNFSQYFTYEWNVTDDCGRQDTHLTTIKVVDTTPPTLNSTGVTNFISLTCNDTVPDAVTMVASDNCNGGLYSELVVDYSETQVGDTCNNSFTITRTWNSSDHAGNTVEFTQTIQKTGQQPIVCTASPLYDIEECVGNSTPLLATEVITCVDICNNDAVVNYTFTQNLGEDDNCSTSDNLIQQYKAVDPTCNLETLVIFTSSRHDTTPPVMSGVPADMTSPGECKAANYTDPTCSDSCNGDVDVNLTSIDELGTTGCTSKFKYNWACYDACGLFDSGSTTLTVVDSEKPVILNTPNVTVSRDCAALYQPLQLNATDDCVSYDLNRTVSAGDKTTVDRHVSDPANLVRKEITVYSASDWCGQTSTFTQTVLVEDNTPPVLNGNFVTEILQCTNAPNLTVTATDDCSLDLVVGEPTEYTVESCGNTGTTEYTWTISDDNGNSHNETKRVIIYDGEAPELNFSKSIDDVTMECDETFSIPTCSVSETCSSATCTHSQAVVNATSRATTGSWIDVHTWTASDQCGNTVTHHQSVTYQDFTAPSISAVSDSVVDCLADDFSAWPTATDACDDNPITDVTNTSAPGCGDTRAVTFNFTATDVSGNMNFSVWTVNYTDQTMPVLMYEDSFDKDQYIACNETYTPPVITYNDTCGTAHENSAAGVLTTRAGSCAHDWSETRKYTPVDVCGNVGDPKWYYVSYEDKIAPVFLNTPAQTTVQLSAGDDFPAIPAIQAIDQCAGNVTDDIVFSENITASQVNCDITHIRTWAVTDDCGNSKSFDQTIVVTEDTNVTCTAVATFDAECGDTDWLSAIPRAVCTDRRGRFVTASSTPTVIFTNATCSCIEDQVVEWTAQDTCGNIGRATTTVNIRDTVPPAFLCVPNDENHECSSDYNTTAANASDVYFADASIVGKKAAVQSSTGTTDACSDDELINTWVAEDCSGNKAYEYQTIAVRDSAGPRLARVPADATVECGCDAIPDKANVSIALIDNCESMNQTHATVMEAGTIGDTGGVINRTFQGADFCGSTVTKHQIFTVVDSTPPVLVGCPAGQVSVSCEMYSQTVPVVSATDECDASVSNVTHVNTTTIQGCEFSFDVVHTWSVTDSSGNAVNQSQTVIVRDNTAPNLVSSDSTCLSPNDNFATFDIADLFGAYDNCDSIVDVDLLSCNSTAGTGSGDFSDECHQDSDQLNLYVKATQSETYTVYATLSDSCGNDRTVSKVIDVKDTLLLAAQQGCVEGSLTDSPVEK